jgi:hypothetical protein
MSKPPIKKRRVILTVKEVSTTQKSPVGLKKSHILKALDAAKELDFNGGDDSSSNSSESGTQQSSDEGGLGDDVLEDPDGLQDSEFQMKTTPINCWPQTQYSVFYWYLH